MVVGFTIEQNGKDAKVTPSGELVVAPLHYDDTKFNELAEPNVGYNFFGPLPQKQFVVTGVWFRADKDVSNIADATVVIYEAANTDTTTVDKILRQFAVVREDIIDTSPLRILVNAGKFVNAKTDDDDIHMNITGYYIEEL